MSKKRKNKYNARKIEIDGIIFDSKDEARYYLLLKNKKKKGEIRDFKMQEEFVLQDRFKNPRTGMVMQPIRYIADFVIIHNDGTEEVVDVKGYPTPVATLKRKIFEKKFNKPLYWVVHVKKRGGWLSYEENRRLINKEKREKEGGGRK